MVVAVVVVGGSEGLLLGGCFNFVWSGGKIVEGVGVMGQTPLHTYTHTRPACTDR